MTHVYVSVNNKDNENHPLSSINNSSSHFIQGTEILFYKSVLTVNLLLALGAASTFKEEPKILNCNQKPQAVNSYNLNFDELPFLFWLMKFKTLIVSIFGKVWTRLLLKMFEVQTRKFRLISFCSIFKRKRAFEVHWVMEEVIKLMFSVLVVIRFYCFKKIAMEFMLKMLNIQKH